MFASKSIRRAAALAGLIIAAWGCRPGPSAAVPPTWVWDQDQASILPRDGARHAWNGWKVDQDAFSASENRPRLIFWSRSGRKVRLRVEYSLVGRPVEFNVNKRRPTHRLEPTREIRTAEFDTILNRGRNFLEFQKKSKDALRIGRILIGAAPDKPAPQLAAGESVTMFLGPGRGRIDWRGSGVLSFARRESLAADPETTSRKTGFLSRSLSADIAMAAPGILTVTAEKGSFDLSRFEYTESPEPPAPQDPPLVKDKPPVFILLADACQSSHLGLYGYHRPTSPRIEEFARDAVVFDNAYGNASFTRSSVRSLLTGMPPEKYGVDNLTRVAESRIPSLPEYLKIKGYRTSIFTSTVTVSPKFGFTKGVDDYFQYIGALAKTSERKIDLDRFGDWLSNPGPLFSYIHFIEPHLPIVAPPPFLDMFAGPSSPKGLPREKRLISLLDFAAGKRRPYTAAEIQTIIDDYDSTIAYVDSEIGRALDKIRKAGLYDEALIVVLSDHGEAMSEHGAWGHASNVFEETTHIPLVVKFPASLGLKGRVPKLVQISDIFPTIVDLFGGDMALGGRSLLEAIRNPALDDALAVSQSISEIAQFGMRWRDWYYITGLKAGQARLYNLAADPLKDAARDAGSVRLAFEARFLSWFHSNADEAESGAAIDLEKLTPAEIENLKSLGYLE